MSDISDLKSYSATKVSAARTKEVIERLLLRVGAVGFRWDSDIPYRDDETRRQVKGRDSIAARIKWQGRDLAFRMGVDWADERQQKQNLRALYWVLKAKVEAIQFGIVEMEQEFLPYLLDKTGERTVYESLKDSGFKLLPEGRGA